jgi:hypothetical protein
MKRVVLTILFCTLTIIGFGQCPTVLENVWTTSKTEEGLEEINTRVDKLVSKVSKHHSKNDIRKLYALFMKTHSQFLHTYVKYTGIEELAKGRYDCLTATSLFAHILTKSGFAFEIVETNYHIFLLVNTSDGEVVLETTDRLGGFVNDKMKINARLADYRKNTLEAATSSDYQYSFSLFKTVDPAQLPGLLYFNQAVKAFNTQNWQECSEKLAAAAKTTDSPRIAELVQLVELQK